MEEIREELEMPEETLESKIFGIEAEVNQMKAMIVENIRKIAEGDDVEGRIYLKSHLEKEVVVREKELAELHTQLV